MADATKKTAPNVMTTEATASASGSVAATSAPKRAMRTIAMKGAVRVSARVRFVSMMRWNEAYRAGAPRTYTRVGPSVAWTRSARRRLMARALFCDTDA